MLGLLAGLGGVALGGVAVGAWLDSRLDDEMTRLSRNYAGRYLTDGQPLVRTAHTAERTAEFDPTTAFEQTADQTVNAVVYVSTRQSAVQALSKYDELFDSPARGSGSGVILTPDGFIVTNNHVIENASSIRVTLNSKEEYEARIVATDPNTDLAVLKIDGEGLPHLRFADSDKVRVGSWVVAVGNPFNLTSTVTAGIVSAKARNIGILRGQAARRNDVDYSIESFIQTDAAVNPGNSGGALVNLAGELIGINTAIASETGSYAGYSFAIPANLAKKVVTDLMQYGVVQRGFVGVNIRDLDAATARREGLKVYEGAIVTGLAPNGAGKAAGIQEGDVLLSVNGKRIRSASELQEQVANYRPGEVLSLDVLRGREQLKLSLTLRNIDGSTQLLNRPKVDRTEVGRLLGASTVELTEAELKDRKLTHGIKVFHLKTDSPLRRAGVPEGFVIQKVDRREVRTQEALQQLLAEAAGPVYIEGVGPNGKRSYYSVQLR